MLVFYAAHRPYSSLEGATPLEVLTETTHTRKAAVRPPLAAARDAPTLAD